MRRLVWLAALVLVAPVLAQAASDDPAAVSHALRQIETIDHELESARVPAADLELLDTRLQTLHQSAEDCIHGQSGAKDKLDEKLTLLGKPTAAEEAAVSKARRDMEEARGQVDQALASCRLLLVRSETLTERLQDRLDKSRAQHLYC